MNEIVIKSTDEFLSAIKETNELLNANDNQLPLWWRGQGVSTWNLWPRLYRDGLTDSEQIMIRLFIRQAAVKYGKVPEKDDLGSWLFLMQHYRLPTRLLDWTESPLVAAYFVVSDKNNIEKDGVIWGLAWDELNRIQDPEHAEIIKTSPYVYRPSSWFGMSGATSPAWGIFSDAFYGNGGNASKKILAIMSNYFDVRQMVQHSTFTIHGTDEPMDTLSDNSKYLAKLIIPKDFKKKLRESLEVFGITESFIFPDLEYLAKGIEDRFQI